MTKQRVWLLELLHESLLTGFELYFVTFRAKPFQGIAKLLNRI